MRIGGLPVIRPHHGHGYGTLHCCEPFPVALVPGPPPDCMRPTRAYDVKSLNARKRKPVEESQQTAIVDVQATFDHAGPVTHARRILFCYSALPPHGPVHVVCVAEDDANDLFGHVTDVVVLDYVHCAIFIPPLGLQKTKSFEHAVEIEAGQHY